MDWKKNLLVLIWFVSLWVSSFAQFDPLHPPNTFQSDDNPHYWKNDPPYDGYWQQDVHYKINAKIDEKTHIIHGQEELTYWNNSPDTLTKVYFHLYQNAFQPGSYYSNLWKNNKRPLRFGPYEKKGWGTEVDSLRVNGRQVKTTLDNTVLKVQLPEPLYPGDSIQFNMDFRTYFDDEGIMRRRMNMFSVYSLDTFGKERQVRRFKHYNGVHWYPRIAVYDRKFGWTTDQHLDKEFYGDFGTFDVSLTFASNYVVGATGYLQNRSEVMPNELRQKLDISNFLGKDNSIPVPAVVEYKPNETKTWKYHAENVHDFAFTADPTYRMDSAKWNGIKSLALVQQTNVSGWDNAAEYTKKLIKKYHNQLGAYEYPKMIVADARDGMEYPMLTLDSREDPGYRDLLAHEVVHNWFFGMLGNNETYRAAMDEGFTQFSSTWALEQIEGEYMPRKKIDNAYKKMFRDSLRVKDSEIYYGYMLTSILGRDHKLNTHSSDFNGALRHGGGYGSVYYKFGAMLYNLQYVLGDSLYWEAMRHYVEQWKMGHPYFEDFRNSIIRYTDVDLNWFFDQWLETTKKIDYAVKSVKKGDKEDQYIITFERKGEMQMPIDFTVTDQNGKKHKFHIPNTWFVKNTDAKVLPKWYGWGERLQETYEAKVTIPGGIKEVRIDPTNRLADINMLNNSKRCPIDFKFDSKVGNEPDWREYQLRWRPDVWYNSYDGVKAGLHLNGDYMNEIHNFHITAWYNTGVVQGGVSQDEFGEQSDDFDLFSFNFHYKTALDEFSENSDILIKGRMLDGLYSGSIGFDKKLNQNFDLDDDKLYVRLKSMYRPEEADRNYLLYPNEWGIDRFNNHMTVGYRHNYQYIRGYGKLDFKLRSNALFSDYDYSFASFKAKNVTRWGQMKIKTRLYGRWGTGQRIPSESALYLAGASPEKLMNNKYTRSKGIFPTSWAGYGSNTNHFHHGGGLNLRGYSGYLVVQSDEEGGPFFVYQGRSGSAANVELEFDDYININSGLLSPFHLDAYLFGDIGTISYTQSDGDVQLSNFRADAGLGTALTIKDWGPWEEVEPLTIRFDVPLFVNRPPATEDFVGFRWVLGVKRAF